MAQFSFARARIEEVLGYPVAISENENLSEQRRLLSTKVLLGFTIDSPNLTAEQMAEWQEFYQDQHGPLDAFEFTSPFDGVTYTVRFGEEPFRAMFENGLFKVATLSLKVLHGESA